MLKQLVLISAGMALLFAGSAQAQHAGAPVAVSGATMNGVLLKKEAPVYPPIARAAHVQGAVQLHAIISKTGGRSSSFP